MADYHPLDRDDLEEYASASRDLARVAMANFTAFCEIGFSAAEAIDLTREVIRVALTGGSER